MTPDQIQRGGTYYIGKGCGVPFEWAPLILRVIGVGRIGTNWGSAWLTGYQLDAEGHAVERRDIYVGQVAGMRLLQAAAPLVMRPRNAPHLVIPRPRTAPNTTTTGRTR